jgi:hypothetical protein
MEFDWDRAIKRNNDALLSVVAALFAMAGIVEGSAATKLPYHIYRGILLVLRPAESAVRRLVLIASRGLVVKPRMPSPVRWGFSVPARAEGSIRAQAFQLIDPLKRFEWLKPKRGPRTNPRIRSFGDYQPLCVLFERQAELEKEREKLRKKYAEPGPPERLFRRLHALKGALDDLPRQAKRLARWRARRDFIIASKGPRKHIRNAQMRPGLPPGWRERRLHDVDDILKECHQLAIYACKTPNTS